MARLLALCSLPRTDPKQRLQYVRRNGPYALYMTASSGNKLPFGTLPRLLLAWVCTEAVRTQRRELVLGRSLYEFMHKLGLDDQGGGVRGNRVRLRNQMMRLFSCSVSVVYEEAGHKVQAQSFIADRAEYWWDVSRSDAPVLWDTLPRLLLAWVCTEAVRTQRRELVLGRSLYEFMHKLGLDDQGGGVRGNRVRLRNQMMRLFSCSVSVVYEEAGHKVQAQSFIADRAEYWWDVSRSDAPVLWDSTIRLGEEFFSEIIAHPVPLGRSPVGLDLYLRSRLKGRSR